MSAEVHFRQLYLPELLFADGRVETGVGLLVNSAGEVDGFCRAADVPPRTPIIRMPGKALLPGLANAHSHTFQRLFRGRAEGRAEGGDTFWTWREQMYRAAAVVSPEDLYDVARATFLEMVCAGITAVGEFHYLHRDPAGNAYNDPNLMSRQVIAAAQSVGLRICLLRAAYFRAGFDLDPNPGQKRFYEDVEEYLRNLSDLQTSYGHPPQVSIGAAPHSIRAVPLNRIKEIDVFARAAGPMPLHMHISEQVGENLACLAEYGLTPVELMDCHGILSAKTTLIHAIHLTEREFQAIAQSGATICSCPTTERNLGDGIFPADIAARLGIPVALGSDSQAQIDILEDARQLEYHLRLRDQQRGILDGAARLGWARPDGAGHDRATHDETAHDRAIHDMATQRPIGKSLLRSASGNGYAALGMNGGSLSIGEAADFFTVDLEDLSILGLSALPPDPELIAAEIVFGLSKTAIRDVAVDGRLILEDGQHRQADAIRLAYRKVQQKYRDHAGATH